MVIGNGFFNDTKEDALMEMTERAGCKVVKSNFPTIGNIEIYVSERGDLYGQQRVQGKYLTRTKKPEKTGIGYVARISDKKKEYRIHMVVLIYCAFVLHRWEPPDPEFAALLQSYVSQLELMQQREDRVPDHIDNLFQERYGFHYNKDKT